MLKRLLVGLFLGALTGLVVGSGVVFGLHLVTWNFVLAYVLSALTGTLVGLVAGKPIWASGAKIEAGLKAFFGSLFALGIAFALRKWASFSVDLTVVHAGEGSVGDLPLVVLPVIGALLGAFYEADNTPEDAGDTARRENASNEAAKAPQKKRAGGALLPGNSVAGADGSSTPGSSVRAADEEGPRSPRPRGMQAR